MLQANCSPMLLFVATLLMVSCCCTGAGTEDAADCPIDIQGTFNLTNNATEITHFALGISANLFAVLLFGSSVVPIKRVETGDGMFYQWVSCAAIWALSMVGDLILHSPKFYPIAMLGGVIWATGNVLTVPTVKAIGLSLGLLISGSFSLLMGWASSRFGWFGIDAQEVPRPMLNYCGAALCLLSGVIFFFVKVTVEPQPNSERTPLLFDRRAHAGSCGSAGSYEFCMDAVRPRTRQLVGYLMAVTVGLLYGSSVVPVLYIENHSKYPDSPFYGASVFDLDYVFAMCCGIFATSTVYFIFYCAAMQNRPRVYSRVIFPGILSGFMWVLATYSWFLANNYLSSVVTFPIVTAGYGLVAALWGCLVFKEIKGFSNFFTFLLASCVGLTGSFMTAFSKL